MTPGSTGKSKHDIPIEGRHPDVGQLVLYSFRSRPE